MSRLTRMLVATAALGTIAVGAPAVVGAVGDVDPLSTVAAEDGAADGTEESARGHGPRGGGPFGHRPGGPGGHGGPGGEEGERPGFPGMRGEIRDRALDSLGITEDDIHQAMLDAVDELVAEGELTEEEGDEVKERMAERQERHAEMRERMDERLSELRDDDGDSSSDEASVASAAAELGLA